VRYKRSAITRQALLDAGRQIFLEDGIEALSVRTVCKTAGASTSSFYNIFESHGRFVETIIREAIGTDHDLARTVIAERIGPDGTQAMALGEAIDMFSALCRSEREQYAAIASIEGSHQHLAHHRREADHEIVNGVANLIAPSLGLHGEAEQRAFRTMVWCVAVGIRRGSSGTVRYIDGPYLDAATQRKELIAIASALLLANKAPTISAPFAFALDDTSLPITTRSLILNAAITVVGEDGIEDLSLNRVAQLAHVGPSTIYAHYPSREALLVAAIDETASRCLRLGQHLAHQCRTQGEPVNQLLDVLLVLDQVIDTHQSTVLAVERSITAPAEITRIVEKLNEHAVAWIVDAHRRIADQSGARTNSTMVKQWAFRAQFVIAVTLRARVAVAPFLDKLELSHHALICTLATALTNLLEAELS
jgi:AcrR family transcriptional regulator